MKKILNGTTRKVTWINSGITPSAIYVAVIDGTETLVSSASMTSSGNGHYYANVTMPSSIGFYAVQTGATISSNPYINREPVQIVAMEVD